MGSTRNIPEADSAFYEKSRMVVSYVLTNNERLKVDNLFLSTSIEPAYQNWTAKYKAYLPTEMRTAIITAEKNNAKKHYFPLFRKLVSGLLSNPNVTNADLAAMDLHRAKGAHTPAPVPASWPVVQVDINTPRVVKLKFTDSLTLKKAKPKGVQGAVIRYALLETQPTDINDLTSFLLDTRTPCSIEFSESQRGKKLYFCLAWQNTRGKNGPWGPIGMSIVS